MTVQEWLQNGDPAVARLARMRLLDGAPEPRVQDGWIGQFLERYDFEQKRWGLGIYSPKWDSTFYTLRDLQSLDADPALPACREALDQVILHMWRPKRIIEMDVCVLAMMLDMAVWADREQLLLDEMADVLISQQFPDGGWNCDIKRGRREHSSIHTTLSAVEALTAYERHGRDESQPARKQHPCNESQSARKQHPCNESQSARKRHLRNESSDIRSPRDLAIRARIAEGTDYLLRKRLFRRETTGEPIFKTIADFHYPTRWKYDVLRALVHLAECGHPYDPRMEEALTLLKTRIAGGTLGKGATYSGRLHFRMETDRHGRMNTLHGLQVLKAYDAELFSAALDKPVQ